MTELLPDYLEDFQLPDISELSVGDVPKTNGSDTLTPELPKYSKTGPGEDELPSEQSFWKERRAKFWKRTATIIGLIALGVTARYLHNIEDGMHKYEHDTSSASQAFMPSPEADYEAQDTLIFDFSGLSGNDAHKDTGIMEPVYAQHGEAWSMRYGREIDTGALANKIVEIAKQQGKKKVALSGRSMGGIVALETAMKIYEGDNDLEIPYIILDCSPSSIGSVRPDKLTGVDYITWILSHVPGIQYSSDANFLAQYGGQLLGHPEQLVDGNVFQEIGDAAEAYMDINSPQKASITLIQSEFNAIVASQVKQSFEVLSNTPSRPKPVIVLLQPANPDNDTTVDSVVSAREYREFADDTFSIFSVVKGEGIYHANPGFTPTEWLQAAVDVFDTIELDRKIDNMNKASAWMYQVEKAQRERAAELAEPTEAEILALPGGRVVPAPEAVAAETTKPPR